MKRYFLSIVTVDKNVKLTSWISTIFCWQDIKWWPHFGSHYLEKLTVSRYTLKKNYRNKVQKQNYEAKMSRNQTEKLENYLITVGPRKIWIFSLWWKKYCGSVKVVFKSFFFFASFFYLYIIFETFSLEDFSQLTWLNPIYISTYTNACISFMIEYS